MPISFHSISYDSPLCLFRLKRMIRMYEGNATGIETGGIRLLERGIFLRRVLYNYVVDLQSNEVIKLMAYRLLPGNMCIQLGPDYRSH